MSTITQQNKIDPTKTVTYRAKFVSDMVRRFKVLINASFISIINNNCFGLEQEDEGKNVINDNVGFGVYPLTYKQLQNLSDSVKVDSYIAWFNKSEESSLFEKLYVPTAIAVVLPLWSNSYIETFYKKGILFGKQKVKVDRKVLKVLELDRKDIDTSELGILSSIQEANHITAVNKAFEDSYRNLSNIRRDMNKSIKLILKEGIKKGIGPIELGKKISEKVSRIGTYRGTLIARTESIKAHHIASINEYENLGLRTIIIKAEWTTARDSRVCSLCKPLDEKVFELNEIRNKIPLHPQCRCAALPYVEE